MEQLPCGKRNITIFSLEKNQLTDNLIEIYMTENDMKKVSQKMCVPYSHVRTEYQVKLIGQFRTNETIFFFTLRY